MKYRHFVRMGLSFFTYLLIAYFDFHIYLLKRQENFKIIPNWYQYKYDIDAKSYRRGYFVNFFEITF